MKHISNNFLQILNINIIAILALPPYIIFYNILPLETPQTLESLKIIILHKHTKINQSVAKL